MLRVQLFFSAQGPTLRLVHNFRHSSQVHVQHVPPGSKTLSPPIEVKMRYGVSNNNNNNDNNNNCSVFSYILNLLPTTPVMGVTEKTVIQ